MSNTYGPWIQNNGVRFTSVKSTNSVKYKDYSGQEHGPVQVMYLNFSEAEYVCFTENHPIYAEIENSQRLEDEAVYKKMLETRISDMETRIDAVWRRLRQMEKQNVHMG